MLATPLAESRWIEAEATKRLARSSRGRAALPRATLGARHRRHAPPHPGTAATGTAPQLTGPWTPLRLRRVASTWIPPATSLPVLTPFSHAAGEGKIIPPWSQARNTAKISWTACERNRPCSDLSFCVRCWRRKLLGRDLFISRRTHITNRSPNLSPIVGDSLRLSPTASPKPKYA